MRISDWSSDVCSSDLRRHRRGQRAGQRADRRAGERGAGEAGMSGARDTLSLAAAEALVVQVLTAAGTSADNAKSVAAALIAAEADGQSGHGLSRVAAYAGQAKSGKVDGHAVPKVEELSESAVRIDAGAGLDRKSTRLNSSH